MQRPIQRLSRVFPGWVRDFALGVHMANGIRHGVPGAGGPRRGPERVGDRLPGRSTQLTSERIRRWEEPVCADAAPA